MRRTAIVVLLTLGAGCGGPVESRGPEVLAYVLVFDPVPNHGSITIAMGSSGTVRATVLDGGGRLVVPDEGPTFRSSNASILAVDPDGHYTSLGGGGAAQIFAEAKVGSTLVTAALTVVFACTEELTVQMTPAAITLDVGQRFTPTMVLKSCGGYVTVPATITWFTPDSGVVSVNPQTGETTALQAGSGTVRGTAASIASSLTGSITVTVR